MIKNESNSNHYIRRDDLDILYSIYSSNKNNPIVEFKLGNNENEAEEASFKLKQDNRTFNIYEEKGNKFEIVGDTKSLNKSEKEIFEKKKSWRLSDLMILKKGTDSKQAKYCLCWTSSALIYKCFRQKDHKWI
nr:hypothetical protein [Mycoplasmopsis bovis]